MYSCLEGGLDVLRSTKAYLMRKCFSSRTNCWNPALRGFRIMPKSPATKFYAVAVGKDAPGIYMTWPEVRGHSFNGLCL